MVQKYFAIWRPIRQGRFLNLFVALILYILFLPWVREFINIALIYHAANTLLLVSSLYAVSQSGLKRAIGVSLAVPALALSWVSFAMEKPVWRITACILLALFLLFIIVSLLQYVYRASDITRHVIFGAISAYLVLGIFWSLLFTLLETFEPGSFQGTGVSGATENHSFLYFSFVTLTTLGYGDILPATAKAQSLAITEAIIGQVYMTVLIAWLVGLNVSRRVEDQNKVL